MGFRNNLERNLLTIMDKKRILEENKNRFRLVKFKKLRLRSADKPFFKKPFFKKRLSRRQLYWKKWLRSANPDRKIYFAFLKRSINNTFITITDAKGRVVVTKSSGNCRITTKKKKRSWDTLKSVTSAVAKEARLKNIRYIKKFFTYHKYMKNTKLISRGFRNLGLFVLNLVFFNKKPHSRIMRKKKMKRL